ncbi:MAG: hypothetical protein RL277_277, partial [Planctomycetota bacterium]
MKNPLNTLPWLALATALSLPWLASDSQAQQLPNLRSTKSQLIAPCTTSTCPDGCTTQIAVVGPITATGRAGTLSSLAVPQFNPGIGTLQRVEVQFSANTINRRYQFVNLAPIGSACTPGVPNGSVTGSTCAPVKVGGDLSATLPSGQTFDPALNAGEYVKFTTWPHALVPGSDIFPLVAGSQNSIVGGGGAIPQLGPLPNPPGELCPVTNEAALAGNLLSCQLGDPQDGGRGRFFELTPGSGQPYAWRNCWSDEPAITETFCVTSNLGGYIGTCGSTSPCCFTPGDATCSSNWPVTISSISLNAVNDQGLTGVPNGGCGQYQHGLYCDQILTVTVRYFYCPANLPPQTLPDIATVCQNVSAACTASVDIPVLANDCDPVTCSGSGTSGRLNCASVDIAQHPTNGSVVKVGCSGVSTNQG